MLSRSTLVLVCCGALLPLSALVAVGTGSADIPPLDVARTIGTHLGAPWEPLPPLRDSIVWNLRLPRVLLAALVGAGLAVCGTVLQAVTRNPLADPYLLGVSAGASTGAVLVLVLGFGALGLPVGAFTGAMAAFGCVLLLLGRSLGSATKVVLSGVVASQLFSALTSLVVVRSGDAERTRAVTFWLLGSLASADWTSVSVCTATTTAGLLVCLLYARHLDALAFGRETASTLGFSPHRTEMLLYGTTAVVTGALVAASGAIGFVGLLVPHAARMLAGATHRVLLPSSALLGAVFLIWADTAARSLFGAQELPVGVLTALLGVPAFAALLRRRTATP
ncbi:MULTISPECIES: FecCD family ABC transporter permease [Streptomyces]|uniref:Iron complex transport system permease protein n=1 Tax=Streptomyces demainii TaxID=588122 RepID=A0ABT9KWC4_9ACTN|nr:MULTISPECIES: iron chelate uptake ABC transporter family permease subunit [Streptomyces]MDN3060368.1 iron chelate uptake ABC transporter family permease subunit [Streptomyces sp. SRF1]MDP9612746.1 iron complex transport system permease protein [Streptomyces demainii]